MEGRYGADALSGDWRAPRRRRAQPVAADTGLVVEEVITGWCGAVTRVESAGGMTVVHLEDRRGRVRGFPLGPGYLLDGKPVVLTLPAALTRPTTASRTASGSRAVQGMAARVARGSRIFVEGRHDAELVERVWGDDLRIEGVVVELLNGVDELEDAITAFRPNAENRLGVLVDHLVPGSKEDRIVTRCRALRPHATHVRIVGHPYVDVWQAVRPQRLGLDGWPVIDRRIEWKRGVLAHLGWPDSSQADIAAGWARILGTVRSYTDLEPSLLAAVEDLIDFVTVGASGDVTADATAAGGGG